MEKPDIKKIIAILVVYLPLILAAQRSSEKDNLINDKALWEGLRERIESTVERGEMTREEANERYAGFRRRMTQRKEGNRSPGRIARGKNEQGANIEGHFRRFGVNDLNPIKNGLIENGITHNQLDAVLGGMLRVIHATKAEGRNFEMNPRIQAYFQDRLGLTQDQVQYVKDVSLRIAKGGR